MKHARNTHILVVDREQAGICQFLVQVCMQFLLLLPCKLLGQLPLLKGKEGSLRARTWAFPRFSVPLEEHARSKTYETTSDN